MKSNRTKFGKIHFGLVIVIFVFCSATSAWSDEANGTSPSSQTPLATGQENAPGAEEWGCNYVTSDGAFLCAQWDENNLILKIEKVALNENTSVLYEYGISDDENIDEEKAKKSLRTRLNTLSVTKVDDSCKGEKGCSLNIPKMTVSVKGNSSRKLSYNIKEKETIGKGKMNMAPDEYGVIEFRGAYYSQAIHAIILDMSNEVMPEYQAPYSESRYRIVPIKENTRK